jgi:hypothetical protein
MVLVLLWLCHCTLIRTTPPPRYTGPGRRGGPSTTMTSAFALVIVKRTRWR